MESYLIKGILIGLIFGMPVGAVGTMTVQRTFRYGFQAGLMTGLGSSVADCLYACVGVFGLTFISDFLFKYQMLINISGGTFVLIMGIRLILGSSKTNTPQAGTVYVIKMFLSSFVVGITNPAAILTFLFAFSYFGISGESGIFQGIQLVCGVFIGTYIWWSGLSAAVCIIRKKTENYNLYYINKIFGALLILFATIVFLKIFLQF